MIASRLFPPSRGRDGAGVVFAAGAAVVGAIFAVALALPQALPLLLAVLAGLGLLVLGFLQPIPFTLAWLLAAGATPEMWFGNPTQAEGLIVGLVKLTGLVLAVLAALRYGVVADLFNPGFAFLAMFAVGLAGGLHPNLTLADSLRSLAGSVAPFAFGFVRAPRSWCDAVIAMVIRLPALVVLGGLGLDLAGVHALFGEAAGLRLAGMGHPAFLAGFALAGVYAALVELFRDGRGRDLAWLGANLLILALTGARAPLMLALAVVALALLFLPARRFDALARLPLLLAAGLLLPLLAVVAGKLTSIRLFNVLSDDPEGLSGRDLIWPLFQDAWAERPWTGWGVGAGKTLVDPDSLIAHLLGTTTAHNEYLRIGVDGGWLGLGLLGLFMAGWVWRHGTRLAQSDKAILYLVFMAFAVHSFTDSTLIATTGCVLFAWVAAVFARGAQVQAAA